MKRGLYAPAVLVVGLLATQLVATAHVFQSNRNLLQTTEAVLHGGYLAVPNALVTPHLESLATAAAGGLFFTLSIGAGLSLATLAAVWSWDRVFRRRRREALLFLLVWLAALWLVNENGLTVVASSYLIVVPLVTAVAAVRLLPDRTPLISPATVLWPVSGAVILALAWGMAQDRHLFVNIRDHLLLTNTIGRSITDAYYAYTLYPAEAFKSLSQKQLRTCVLAETLDDTQRGRLEAALRARDYLPVPAGYPADLIIQADRRPSHISLGDGRKQAASVATETFLDRPDPVLTDVADRLDRHRMFRRLTLICLLGGFPLLLYTFVFSLLAALPGLFLSTSQSEVVTAVVCVVVGVALLVPVHQGRQASADMTDPAAQVSSSSSVTRTAALREACGRQQDVTAAARRLGLATSGSVAERYWLARSLACATDPAARALLLSLADDPEPIVVCQALWAMGQRNDRRLIPTIVDRLGSDPHWYVQMYAYRTLRTLGWVQPRSPRLAY